jgi:hypothetical protein
MAAAPALPMMSRQILNSLAARLGGVGPNPGRKA